jgi:hypothetical protein
MRLQNNVLMKYLFTALFVSSLTFGFAQLKLGPIMGYNYNMPNYSASGDTLSNHEAFGHSFAGGIFGSYELHEHVEFLGELIISGRYHNTRHYKERTNMEFNYYEEHFTQVGSINMEIPLLVAGKKDFRKGRYGLKKTVSGYAGPVFLMNLSDSYYRSSGYRIAVYNQSSIERETVTESPIDHRLINVGVIVGGQYEFKFGLRVGARFQSNLLRENTNPNFDLRYSQLQVNLGYSIIK